MQFTGIEAIRAYPKCEKRADTVEHVERWKNMIELYGQVIPELNLKAQLLNIIPKDLKTEVMRERDMVGANHVQIMDWLRLRCALLKQETMADVVRRNLTSQARKKVHAVQSVQSPATDASDIPVPDDLEDQVRRVVCAMQGLPINAVQPPPKPHAGQRPPRGRTSDRSKSPRNDRLKSPRGARDRSDSRKRFTIDWPRGKCFHCGGDHNRDECGSFKKMMEEANKGNPNRKSWKPPKGYESAIGKARNAAKAKEASKTNGGKMNLLVEDGDDTASESEFSQVGDFRMIAAVRNRAFIPVSRGARMNAAMSTQRAAPVCTLGRFTGLDDQQDYDHQTLAALNGWSVKVTEQKAKPSKKKCPSSEDAEIAKDVKYIEGKQKPDDGLVKILRTEKDINKALDIIAALPQDKKGIAKAFKKVADVQLAEDEILAMIDSGSFENAIDADEDLPDHEVTPPPPNAMEAETACGGVLKNLGTIRIQAEADGQSIGINFVNMKVKCPILSVRNICGEKHEVKIHRHGGVIRHNESGKEIKFFEYRGVYYVKLKVKKPTSQIPPATEAGFARQGA